MATVVGLDGCRKGRRTGWIAAVIEGEQLRIEYCKSAGDAIRAYESASVFAFDIPIGLSATGAREADAAARKALPGRTSSVFNAPPRLALHAGNYAEANAVSRRAGDCGLSPLSYALFEKIREVDTFASDPRVYEVHPEVSFAEMAGAPVLASKKSWDGLMRRRELLARHGLRIPERIGDASGHSTADDIVDAVACAWTAARIASGEARSLPGEPEMIDGREVAIWC